MICLNAQLNEVCLTIASILQNGNFRLLARIRRSNKQVNGTSRFGTATTTNHQHLCTYGMQSKFTSGDLRGGNVRGLVGAIVH